LFTGALLLPDGHWLSGIRLGLCYRDKN